MNSDKVTNKTVERYEKILDNYYHRLVLPGLQNEI